MAGGLHPDFPVVSGQYRMTSEWSLSLPDRFNRRIEEGSLVIWRPELTFWINIWGPKENATLEERVQAVLSRANPARTSEQIERSECLVRLTYEVPEHDPEREVPDYMSIAGYVFGAPGHVQISAYYDSPGARSLAYHVIHSVQSVD